MPPARKVAANDATVEEAQTDLFGESLLKVRDEREIHEKCKKIHSLKLTWHLKMMVSNRNLLFQGSFFRFYVSFREGISEKIVQFFSVF